MSICSSSRLSTSIHFPAPYLPALTRPSQGPRIPTVSTPPAKARPPTRLPLGNKASSAWSPLPSSKAALHFLSTPHPTPRKKRKQKQPASRPCPRFPDPGPRLPELFVAPEVRGDTSPHPQPLTPSSSELLPLPLPSSPQPGPASPRETSQKRAEKKFQRKVGSQGKRGESAGRRGGEGRAPGEARRKRGWAGVSGGRWGWGSPEEGQGRDRRDASRWRWGWG